MQCNLIVMYLIKINDNSEHVTECEGEHDPHQDHGDALVPLLAVGGPLVGGRGVGVQVEVGPSDPGSVSVEIFRPQYAFIIGIFARVNSWTGFVAIVVPDVSFIFSNSSSV